MEPDADVLIVGGGVAGLTAGVYTARAGLETTVVDGGESILRRNAHLENYPGFPAGIDPRLLLDLVEEQAENAGCAFREGWVVGLDRGDGTFVAELDDGDDLRSRYVVATSWSDVNYLEGLGVPTVDRGSKTFVDAGPRGETGVEGLYAAGRVAERHHQAVVAAGSGAEAALSLIEASDVDFYHDWVVPEGYFTDRGREVPPGCEEIDDAERRRRAERARETMLDRLAEPRTDEPTPHPSLADE